MDNHGLLLFLVLLVHLARQTEVDDFHLALRVHEDVGGLEIAVDEIAALALNFVFHRYLHIQQATEDLVQERLHMLLSPTADALGVAHNLCHIPPPVFLKQ